MNRKRLEGKIALITGAARGIGQTTAHIFTQEGALVILSDILDSEGEQQERQLGSGALYMHLDVLLESDWVSVINSILDQFGRLGHPCE